VSQCCVVVGAAVMLMGGVVAYQYKIGNGPHPLRS
jgi:hypothetical protein